jgi:hypothetical protein
MSQPITDKDFQPLPTYSQSTTQNQAWVNVTVTRTDPDGSKSQVSFIEKK